jgi:hypothetical protein
MKCGTGQNEKREGTSPQRARIWLAEGGDMARGGWGYGPLRRECVINQ